VKKIIFLDIDGVLNVYCQGRDVFGCTFHKHFEDNLRLIIEQTGAKIVISSTWRYSGLKVMKEMWISRGLAGEVIDITPDMIKFVDNEDIYESVERGEEIHKWLDDHSDIESYVIIDDDDDMLESQKDNFVLTANNSDHEDCVDIGYGLTRICAEKAIEILNKK